MTEPCETCKGLGYIIATGEVCTDCDGTGVFTPCPTLQTDLEPTTESDEE